MQIPTSSHNKCGPTSCYFVIVLLFVVTLLAKLQITAAVPIIRNESDSKYTMLGKTFRNHIMQVGNGWFGFGATILTTLPWAIVAVFDSIDHTYRTVDQVARRLMLATLSLLLAYVVGILFCVSVTYAVVTKADGRHDEVAAVVVLLIFNLYHVARNIRGWSQFCAIRKVGPSFKTIQENFATSFSYHEIDVRSRNSDLANSKPSPTIDPTLYERKRVESKAIKRLASDRSFCIQGLLRLRISNSLIDNDWNSGTPFLNPFYCLKPRAISQHPTAQEEAWSVALWRAWWTQDTFILPTQPSSLTAPTSFHCDKVNRHPDVEDLLNTAPSGLECHENEFDQPRDEPLPPVTDQATGETITTKTQWARALLTYGGPEGQQDTHGESLACIMNVYDASAIAILIQEKTCFVPNRMSSLWYDSARFECIYNEKAFDTLMQRDYPHVMFPSWPGWLKIGHDIAKKATCTLSVTDRSLNLFAGELAATSLLLVRYSTRYSRLVEQIYQDGLNARWTFGWSGLLACFSHLWTRERIYVAMLNGLSLLALASKSNVADIDPNVRSTLYGYAAFAVSDRAVGRRVVEDRNAELLRRYSNNKGKTCRGTGLCAIRLACRELGLPSEASYMDGLPAFSAGWAGEFMERKPGNQAPEHGHDHDEVESIHGSCNVWRFPYSHT